MENKRIYEDLSPLTRRSHRVFVFLEILLGLLAIYFWKIQIIDHKKYWQRSEANRVREVILSAPRGIITDRGDKILAENIASFKASVIRENSKNLDLSCRRIARLLNLEEDVLRKRIEKYKFLPLFKPIVVKDNLTMEEVYLIEGRKLEFPELVLQTEPKRYYPYGSFAAHTLGYLQELSEEEIQSGIYKERRLGDMGGKTGIEKEYDTLLRGRDGQCVEIVDSLGRNKGEIARREPVQGFNLKLTLDFKLQKTAEELLEGKEGAVIVLDVKKGEILALASYPTYDPNKFINRFTPEEWLDLVNDPEFPLENRAIRGLYAPGSVFKLTMALGSLDMNLITESTVFSCHGKIKIYGQSFSCWSKQGHGLINLPGSIKHSCNIYFYNLGRKLGIEEIARYTKMVGFGAKTGIDLPGEKEGLVPTPEWKRKARNLPWYPGETISVSIGQGPLLVTPLQVAFHTALIANRGKRIFPHLLQSYSKSVTDMERVDYPAGGGPRVGLKPSSFEKVIKGMFEAVNEGGTARLAKVKGFNVCGKTGSTQIISTIKGKEASKRKKEIKTHSWFTGFAPLEEPEIVVTVIVEYGGLGGEKAAPLAKKLFELYREGYDRQKSS